VHKSTDNLQARRLDCRHWSGVKLGGMVGWIWNMVGGMKGSAVLGPKMFYKFLTWPIDRCQSICDRVACHDYACGYAIEEGRWPCRDCPLRPPLPPLL